MRGALLYKEFLARIDFAARGQLVDPQEAFQGHVVFHGDGVRAVAPLDRVGAELACGGQRFGFESGYLQGLPDIKMIGRELIQFAYFLNRGSIAIGDNPQGVALTHIMSARSGNRGAFCLAGFALGEGVAALGDL